MNVDKLRKMSEAELKELANVYDIPYTEQELTIKKICEKANIVYIIPELKEYIKQTDKLAVPYIFGLMGDDSLANVAFMSELLMKLRYYGISNAEISIQEKSSIIATWFLKESKMSHIGKTIYTVLSIVGDDKRIIKTMEKGFSHLLMFASFVLTHFNSNQIEALYNIAVMDIMVSSAIGSDEEILTSVEVRHDD